MAPENVVHVVDDDLGVRQALAFLVATASLSVRVYESGTAFLDCLKEVAPGCLVTDVRMPGVDGIELLRRVRSAGAPLSVVVMTGHADVPLAVQAMKEGAVDFIEKPFDDGHFLAAVRSALAAPRVVPSDVPSTGVAGLAKLSPRERHVLEGILAGKPNKVIAHDLDLSPRTVEVYRANVMRKTGAASLPELVRLALRGVPS